jgi:ubiquinone/menaquinone biosynthesis C-methylase UbiE
MDGAVTESRPDPEPTEFLDSSPAYDAIASRYGATFSDELTRKPFDRELLDRFSAGMHERATADRPLCDLGCGPGHIGAYVADRGVPVIGVDLSEGMVQEARARFPALTFEQGDMTALSQPDRSFAGVTCFYAVIHLPRSVVPRALAEMRRTLVDGGELLLSAHGGTGSLHADTYLDQAVAVDATLFSLPELVGLVEGAGCVLVEAHERAPYEDELQTPRLYVWARRTG